MSALVVEQAGRTSTLQDGGRIGHARYGVPRSGPVDPLSHRLAALLGGVAPAAVAATTALEVGSDPCTLRAEGTVAVALAGAGARLRGGRCGVVPAPCVVALTPGERVTVEASTWAYLVPAADIDVARVLGSRSSHPRSGLGPSVSDGTHLALGEPRDVRQGAYRAPPEEPGPLLVLPGPQTDAFDDAVRDLLGSASYRTTTAVDRMGQRLDGPLLQAAAGHDIVSDGIVPGALQVPGDGRPYVLTADHQTTGGYPKIGVLGTAALARFVRQPPGTDVRFRWGTPREARAELRAAHRAIEACASGPVRPTGAQLSGVNLVDGVSDGS